ncbi:hypothetical protein MTO96_020640 [Rhipicephalus appendiculatus]
MSARPKTCVRKLQKPPPLAPSTERSSSDPDESRPSLFSSAKGVCILCESAELIGQLEALCASLDISLANGNYGTAVRSRIGNVCSLLKLHGATLEAHYKDKLDVLFVTLHNASRDDALDALGRWRLLEVLKLRIMGWQIDEDIAAFFSRKYKELEAESAALESDASAVQPACACQEGQQQKTKTTGTILKPPKGEATLKNNTGEENLRMQETQMSKVSGRPDLSGMKQYACAGAHGLQTERAGKMTEKVVAEQISRHIQPRIPDGKRASGAAADLGQQRAPSAIPHVKTGEFLRTLTIGSEVVYVTGVNKAVVDRIASVLQSLFPNMPAGKFSPTK